MSLTKFDLKNQNLTLYTEDDKGILFNQSNSSLYSLSAISVALVLLFDEGLSQQDILDTLEQKTGLAKTKLIPLYNELVDMLDYQSNIMTYSDGQYPELKELNSQHKIDLTKVLGNTYLIADAKFSLQGPSDLVKDLALLLAPRKHFLEEVDFALHICLEQGLYCIYSNSILVEQCEQYQEVIPLVIDRLQILAFQKSDYSFCFHGAALSCSKFNLLLPGESGAGKSTLSALLMDEKHQLFSDEFIALNDDFHISVIALPIAVKYGSWQVVGHKYPELAEAKIWRRLDGRRLKYLWPASFAELSAHSQPNTVLIHPQYSDRLIDAEVSALSVIEALTLLTASGYQLGFELNTEKLEKLIEFVQKAKKWRITYCNNEQITQVLRTLV